MTTRRDTTAGLLASVAFSGSPATGSAQELKSIRLPSPRIDGGMPLLAALKRRHSTREYSDRPITAQTLSDLIWAAFGINRPNGDRTARTGDT